MNNFNLTIVVMDRGQPPLIVEHNIIVNISDVNDCIPDFNSATTVSAIINENLPNG